MRRARTSASLDLRRILLYFRRAAAILREDFVALYAAQASFFILLSAIPALMLLLSLSRQLAPSVWRDVIAYLVSALPSDFRPLLSALFTEITQSGTLPLLSLTSVTALWSASRGLAALERGLSGVYGFHASRGYVIDVLRSAVSTVVFLLLLIAALLLLVFGAGVADALLGWLPALAPPIEALLRARGLIMLTMLTLFFFLFHRTVRRRAKQPSSPMPLLPGALFSAVGWMLFSYFYSLYIRFFPRASYLVGSLAVLVLLMLWLYFCMTILLLGAEVNKLWAAWRRKNSR